MRFTGFIGPSYTLQSLNVDAQRCMNLYPELDALGTGKEKEVAALVSSPGLTSQVVLPASPVRGVWTASNGTLFAVGGQYLYSVSSSWVATQVGQLNSSAGSVSMSDNGTSLIVVDGTWGYTLTLSNNNFAQITDPNFLGATLATFMDGYFILNKPGTKTFYCSDLNAVSFTALNSGQKSGFSDNLVGQISCQQNLYLFGAQSTEVWYDAGTTPLPFARVQGALVQVGCAAAFSIAKVQNTVFFVGGDDTGVGIVYQMQGYQPSRISTPAIEASLRSVGTTNLSNARAWTYQQGGHIFYALNVPGLSATWVFDTSTSLWHERAYLGSFGLERHRADCASVAYGLNIVGDYATGAIYSLDNAAYTDNGTSIVRMRTAPHFAQDMMRLFHERFILDLETGVGTSTGQGQSPQAALQWSDDGGHTWSNEHWADIGKIGATKTRAMWRRLGSSRDRVYRVVITDPVKVTLIGAELDIAGGAA